MKATFGNMNFRETRRKFKNKHETMTRGTKERERTYMCKQNNHWNSILKKEFLFFALNTTKVSVILSEDIS